MPKQPETPTVPSGYQESSPTVKTFPQTGEKNSNVLLFIGFTLILRRRAIISGIAVTKVMR